MKAIYKYELLPVQNQAIELPKGYEILRIGTQGNKIFLWAKVDRHPVKIVAVPVKVVATGDTFDDESCIYIGTVDFESSIGTLVLHFFKLEVLV